MKKNKENFIQPGYHIFRQVLEAFAVDREDAFGLKLYDLNTILDRHKKKLEDEEY